VVPFSHRGRGNFSSRNLNSVPYASLLAGSTSILKVDGVGRSVEQAAGAGNEAGPDGLLLSGFDVFTATVARWSPTTPTVSFSRITRTPGG
jgi:hypothetical protein